MNARLSVVDGAPLDRSANHTQNQRQHPRYKLPLEARVGGRLCQVLDWSIGGVGLIDAPGVLVPGRSTEVEMVLPLRGCKVEIVLKGIVRYRNTDGRAGLQFTEVTHEQLAMLQFVIDEYLAGRVTDADGVLEFAMHSPVTKPRSTPIAAQESAGRRIKDGLTRALGLLFAALVGLGAVALIASSLYRHLYVFEAVSAQVAVPSFETDSPVAGTVTLVTQARSVTTKDELFRIRELSGNEVTVPAPCDCVVVTRPTSAGNFVTAGQPVVVLAANDAAAAVAARIPFTALGRIYGGAHVTLRYLDGVTVTQDTSVIKFPSLLGEAGTLIEVQIPPGRQLLADAVGQPVAVSFDTFSLPFSR